MTVDRRHRRIRVRADGLGARFPGLLDPILHHAAPAPAADGSR